MTSRSDIGDQLDRWAGGTLTAADLRAWAESQARTRTGDPVIDEVLADLDLLQVHLLTPEDIPALHALLATSNIPAWRAHLAAIDLETRSRRLRHNPLYKPFCR